METIINLHANVMSQFIAQAKNKDGASDHAKYCHRQLRFSHFHVFLGFRYNVRGWFYYLGVCLRFSIKFILV